MRDQANANQQSPERESDPQALSQTKKLTTDGHRWEENENKKL
jgi:hypothetical protein